VNLTSGDGFVYNGVMTKRAFWTAQQLAEAAGVNDSYIRRLLIDGKLRGQKFGKVWAIPDDVATTWLTTRKAKKGDKVQQDLKL